MSGRRPPSLRMCSIATSRPRLRTANGSLTSPASGPRRAGSTWRPCSISSRGGCWLVDERAHDGTTRHRRFDDGDLAARQAGDLAASFRRGSQYTSEQFQRLLADHGITCSMSGAGNVWDNAVMESFFSSLKTEWTARRTYRTRDEARADVFDYVERFYNPRRQHEERHLRRKRHLWAERHLWRIRA